MSPDEEELIWGMSADICSAYREGQLNERYFLPFGAIMMGNPNAPGMGWPELARLLKDSPRCGARRHTCAGVRYLKKEDPATALAFFKIARADADREPPQDLLGRLADARLGALAPK